jgi:tetratricopeptide (TPR) repeat protein
MSGGVAVELDPDALAELERERDFLLRSLDDLDAEHAAGDLGSDDYAALADDYTRRLAEVARSIDQRRAAFAKVDNSLSTRQRVLTVIGIVVFAVLAGWLLARASGFRSPDGSTTGDIRQSSTGLLAEADTLTREGQWPEAIEVYNEALQVSPGNVEALTYRGWLTARLGDNAAGLDDLAEAVAVDPTYPDARVFSAILLDDEQRFDEAADQLDALDSLDTPDEMFGLIEASNLRASVAAGQIATNFAAGEQIDLAQVTGSPDDIARAGALLSQVGDIVRSQATFDAVLAEDPDNVVALVGKGQLARDPGIFAASPEIAISSLEALDSAVELAAESDRAVIQVYRADARLTQGDPEGAKDDFDAVDREALSADLQALYDRLATSLE